MEIQKRFNDKFNKYLILGEILASDLVKLSESEDDSAYWRRNYIRGVASFLEGYSHCFRELAAIGLQDNSTSLSLSKKEQELFLSRDCFPTSDRIKLSLRVFCKMFELSPVPDFSSGEWKNAMKFFEKRNALMHPKSLNDLECKGKSWSEVHKGGNWLIKIHFDILAIIFKKHIKKVAKKSFHLPAKMRCFFTPSLNSVVGEFQR